MLHSKQKPPVPETLIKKKKQRVELLQKRLKNAAVLKKVYKLSAFYCMHLYYKFQKSMSLSVCTSAWAMHLIGQHSQHVTFARMPACITWQASSQLLGIVWLLTRSSQLTVGKCCINNRCGVLKLYGLWVMAVAACVFQYFSNSC